MPCLWTSQDRITRRYCREAEGIARVFLPMADGWPASIANFIFSSGTFSRGNCFAKIHFRNRCRVTRWHGHPIVRNLLTPGPNGSAQLRDPVTGKTLATFPAANGEAILTGAFSADGKTAVLTTRDRQFRTFSVVLWTVDPPRQQKVLYRHTKQITALAISPNGRLLASGDQSGTIRLYQHSDTAPKVVTMTVSRKVVALRFDPPRTISRHRRGWLRHPEPTRSPERRSHCA